MSGPATWGAIERLARPLRRLGQAAWLALGLGALALVLGMAAWLVRLGWVLAPWWVLAAWLVGITVAAACAVVARRALAALSAHRVAGTLEREGSWRRGALTALLEPPAAGASDALLAAADAASAGEVERRGPAALHALAHATRLRVLAAAALLVLGLAAFTSAGPVRGTANALWHPRRAWAASIAPVTLRASATSVERGARVDLEVRAVGRRNATLWTRAPGDPWTPRLVALDSAGIALEPVGPLAADLYARVTSGRHSSDTVLVRVRLPIFLGTLTLNAHYPAYLHLDDEALPTSGDTLVLPAGTRLDTRGEATAPLRSAAWRGASGEAPLAVNASHFSGSFTPGASGRYELALSTVSGAGVAGDTIRLPVRVVPDSAPTVALPVPGSDTTAPVSLTVPIVVDARDDHGLSSVTLESRRISRLGFADSAVQEEVALPPGRPDRAILNATLDLNHRGLLPGDTVRYFARAVDNAPSGHAGRSREYVLRLPTLSEVRALQRQASAQVAARLDSITEQSRKVERAAEDLSQEQPRMSSDPQGRTQDALKYEDAKKAEAIAQSQQQLLRQADQLRQALEQLKQSAQAAGVGDSAWQRQLDQIREQLDHALTPELRQKLAELQQSLKNLDAEHAKQSLEQLAQAQKELREALERSKELFRRAALEGDLANLKQESRELASAQQQWNDQVHAADRSRAAAEERALAQRTDSLHAALDRVATQAAPDGKQQPLQDASAQAQQAGRQMRQAGTSAQQGQRPAAQQQGERAEQSLQPLGDQIEQAQQSLAQKWRDEVAQAINAALGDISRLSRRQLDLSESLTRGAPPAQSRADQAAIEEGVQRLADQVRATAGKNALVSPQIATSLAQAQKQMQESREALSSGSPNPREAAERAGSAVDAMNGAAYQLLRAQKSVSGAGSGSGLAEAMQQMAQMASKQGQLGQEAAGLLPMAGGGAIGAELQRLAAQQRALAEQLERMRGQGNMPGAGEMGGEAKDLARQLEAGRLDRQTVERQERLFRRMLDAGRTLQGHEEDEKQERQSTTAKDDSMHLPPALRQRLEDDQHRLRLPSWDELQQLSPGERRLVVDYFRRLAESERQ